MLAVPLERRRGSRDALVKVEFGERTAAAGKLGVYESAALSGTINVEITVIVVSAELVVVEIRICVTGRRAACMWVDRNVAGGEARR